MAGNVVEPLKMAQIGPKFGGWIWGKFDRNFCVCRLGAHTLKIFLVRKGTNLPYMCAKYHWLTPCGLGDTSLQK